MPKNRWISIKVILFSYIEGLCERRKYLGAIFSNYVPPEDSQQLLQRLSRKINNNISTLRLYFTHNKANNQAFHKAKMRTANKI